MAVESSVCVSIICLGILGFASNTRSLLFLLVYLELSLLGAILYLGIMGEFLKDPYGQFYAVMLLVAAAAESAVVLSIIVLWYKTTKGANIYWSRRLKG